MNRILSNLFKLLFTCFKMDSPNLYDPIKLFWVLLWTSISSYGLCLLKTENKTASSFYVYGKSLETNKKGLFWRLYLLPKGYFRHFYLLSTSLFLSSLALVIAYYAPTIYKPLLVRYLDKFRELASAHLKIETVTTINAITSLLFTLILMIIQSTRRLYESLFISVYSSNSKINIIHYIFGHSFYIAAALSTICPILFSQTSSEYTLTTLSDSLVTKKRAIVFVLFVYVSHHQYKCHQILANLRKDKTGKVITEQHFVPSGGLFEFLTCPHFLLEAILYFLITVTQDFSNSYWNLICLLVASTQTINAVTEHRWYKRKYKDYPKQRKAILPGLL